MRIAHQKERCEEVPAAMQVACPTKARAKELIDVHHHDRIGVEVHPRVRDAAGRPEQIALDHHPRERQLVIAAPGAEAGRVGIDPLVQLR